MEELEALGTIRQNRIRRLRQDYDDAVKTLNRARERLDQIVEELEELGAVP